MAEGTVEVVAISNKNRLLSNYLHVLIVVLKSS